MPLASKLAFQFERRLQFKGVNLFHAHAVRITEANQTHLFGEVQGGSRYPVRMTHESGRLRVYCACAYFADFGRCKHLWAAVLEADRRGVLGEALKDGALRLFRDPDPDAHPDEPDLAPLAVSPAGARWFDKDEIRRISKTAETTWDIGESWYSATSAGLAPRSTPETTRDIGESWDEAAGTLIVTSAIPETTWDISESWDRVNLRVRTRVGSFASASPLQISLPWELTELKTQFEYCKKNAALTVAFMSKEFIEQAQALKKDFCGKLIAGGIPPVVLRPLDRRTPSAKSLRALQRRGLDERESP